MLDSRVLAEFLTHPVEMKAVAREIRAGVRSGSFQDDSSSLSETFPPFNQEAREGRLLERRHYRRERDPKLRRSKIEKALRERGHLRCETCEFDFEATYGEQGRGYIECHHVVPLHASGETTTRLEDLVLICANCHRMIHRSSRWLTPGEVRELVREGRGH
ncbi:HNH endonuclease [Actinoalloteichus caeruleus]|uniref:HNH endonuclease n=1 Tax=Actinoalloteichus cyanogriseus TaxID=2893586 RepID=UPI003AAEAA70